MRLLTARELAAFLAGILLLVVVSGLVDVDDRAEPTCVVGGSGGLPAIVIEGPCPTVIR